MTHCKVKPYGLFALLFLLLGTVPATAGDTDSKSQEMMALWQAYATPGKNHKALEVLVGQWDNVGKWWMDPNGPPDEFRSVSEIQWILGGRFLKHVSSGPGKGEPFEGMGLTGYDNAEGKYQSIWLDNMGTGMMTSEGTYDPGSKTFKDNGRFTDPVRGSTAYRGVTQIIDNDHFQYQMFTTGPDGKDFLSLVIDYKRKK